MVTLLHLTPQIIKFLPGPVAKPPNSFSPEGGSYPDRTFDFRLSTATVEVEKSNFTDLTGYHRILMPLNASIQAHPSP
ncbi:MAG: HutD family protein [Streptococcus sp.]